MARKLPIHLLVIMGTSFFITTIARNQLRNCFPAKNSDINAGARSGACINHVTHATQRDTPGYGSSRAEIEKGSLAAPPPNSSASQPSFTKTVVVIMILAFASGATTFLFRIIYYCCRSVRTNRLVNEENERRFVEIGNVDPQRPTNEENESTPIGIRNVGPERPTYEPRPIGGAPLDNKLIICNCNNAFSFCGLSL